MLGIATFLRISVSGVCSKQSSSLQYPNCHFTYCKLPACNVHIPYMQMYAQAMAELHCPETPLSQRRHLRHPRLLSEVEIGVVSTTRSDLFNLQMRTAFWHIFWNGDIRRDNLTRKDRHLTIFSFVRKNIIANDYIVVCGT
jgi:hypothetical protein